MNPIVIQKVDFMKIFKKTILTWTKLRSMSNSRAIKSSYFWFFFVPILAKSLDQLERIQFTVFGQQISVNTDLPFSWEMFFYSAVFMAFANLIFVIFAPEFIKSYSSCTEYMDKGHSAHQIVKIFLVFIHEANKAGKNPNDIKNNTSDFLRKYCENGDSLASSLSSSEITPVKAISTCKLLPNQECGAFYHAQEFIDKNGLAWRVVSSWSYWLGFAFIGIVFLQNIWFVLDNHLLNN